MTIQAKFPGRCTACGLPFAVGSPIEWVRGSGARHAVPALCSKARQEAEQEKQKTPLLDLPTLNLGPLVKFFHDAQLRGLKAPKLRVLYLDGKSEMRVGMTRQGNHPGSLSVVVDGIGYMGLVKPNGAMTGQVASTPALQAHLSAVAKDPITAAQKFAALTCRCSFCNLPLVDEGSVDVGYGPVCAKHWGLPHKPKGVRQLGVVPGAPLQLEGGR